MKSGHEDVRDILPEYVNDGLDEEKRRAVETHLAVCQDCRDELVLIVDLRDLEIPDPGDLFWKTFPKRVIAQTADVTRQKKLSRLWWLFTRPLPIGSALVVAALLFFVFMNRDEAPELATFLKDSAPITSAEYADLSEASIALMTKRFTDEDMEVAVLQPLEDTYAQEVASLSAEELRELADALDAYKKQGG